MVRVSVAGLVVAILAAVAACGGDGKAQPAPPPDDVPPGFLVYLVERENPPACSDPCEDDDPPASGSSAWLELAPPDGGERRRVSCVWEDPGECKEGEGSSGRHNPVFSPSGSEFATTETIDVPGPEPGEVLIHDLEGRVVDRVTAPGNTGGVAWSPDGRKLAVATDWPRTWGGALYLISRKSKRRRLLARHAGPVKWSARNLLATQRLVVMRLDGRIVHRFRHEPTAAYDWSPDGKTLAFECKQGICAARYDGSKRRVLTRRCTGYNWSNVAWSPDGRWIACYRRGNLVAVRLHDGLIRVIRPTPDEEIFWDVDWAK